MKTALPHAAAVAPPRPRPLRGALALLFGALGLAACGGGGGGLDNPPNIANPDLSTSSRTLSFEYFQRCVQPIYLAELLVHLNGRDSLNTCAASGCHDNEHGTGGSLRLIGAAPAIDLEDASNTPEVVRATAMYRNYVSSLGSVQFSSPADSRLLTKPMVRGVLHGGGLIFESADDPNARRIRYWISHPMPADQDEFGPNAHQMFSPPDPKTGACLSE